MGKTVIIEDYHPQWAFTFQEIRTILGEALGNLVRAVEHVGSTAVPGLAAKPALDIDLVVGRPDLAAVIEKLDRLGYDYRGDQGVPDREAFRPRTENAPFTRPVRSWMYQHLYVCPPDSRELQRHLAFRDFLRGHPGKREEYDRLKRSLAVRFREDPPAYTEAKTAFIEDILARCSG